MRKSGRRDVIVTLVLFFSLLFLLLSIGAFNALAKPDTGLSGWRVVFETSFDEMSPSWAITDDTGDQYRWNVVPYTLTDGSLVTVDSGFWVAGGGVLGEAQTWPMGTYTNSMVTWAVAGPFTVSQNIYAARLQLDVQSRLASGDRLLVGFSTDGIDFTSEVVTGTSSEWQHMFVSTSSYTTGSEIWIGLGFESDVDGVATGPLVDNVSLEFNYGSEVYLPLVRLDPTSTPTPTPTSTPTPTPTLAPYIDNFSDPSSGWHTGPVSRYNSWCTADGSKCNTGWEVVTTLAYQYDQYRMYVPLTWHGGGDVDTWFVWPAETAPLPESYYPLSQQYCVEARGIFAGDVDYEPWWAHWGVVFGANEALSEVYTFQINANHDAAALRYHNYTYPGNRQPMSGEEINVEIKLGGGWSGGDLNYIYTHQYNTIKVAVNGSYARLYVNGHYMDMIYQPEGIPRGRIGVISGSWEMTPVDLYVDYFKYDPNCPEASW